MEDSKTTTALAAKPTEVATNPIPTLGLFEDDDEFEEFEVPEGFQCFKLNLISLGWNEEQQQTDELIVNWEENWDDDSIDDNFSKQLKYSIIVFTLINFYLLIRAELSKAMKQ